MASAAIYPFLAVAPLAGSVDRNAERMEKQVKPWMVAPLAGSVDRNGSVASGYNRSGRSLPSRGAWIEICKSPPTWAFRMMVAPLAGSVDRNRSTLTQEIDTYESLPSRGAWIEILPPGAQRRLWLRSLPSRGAWIEMRRKCFGTQS